MKDLTNVTKHLFITLHDKIGASLLIAVLSMFTYMYFKDKGFMNGIKNFAQAFRHQKGFARLFLLNFYASVLLFITIFCRDFWGDPVSAIMGHWQIYTPDGSLDTENIENVVLFVPFTALLLWNFRQKIYKNGKVTLVSAVLKSFMLGFVFSLSIEVSQVLFKIGTFQYADLVCNTIGGVVGGVVYYMIYKIVPHDKN